MPGELASILPRDAPRPSPVKRVLHVGCGVKSPHRLHPVFRSVADWQEVRLDLDPAVRPDFVCSTTDMRSHIPSASVDAVWCSHMMEHLHDHEVTLALSEFRRVLKPMGFFLMRCPDLEAVAQAILASGIEAVSYVSPAGPISPLDMLYGHRASIERGNAFMVHKTGFTDLRLIRILAEAGFEGVNTKRTEGFDLWAVAFRAEAEAERCLAMLARSGLSFAQ